MVRLACLLAVLLIAPGSAIAGGQSTGVYVSSLSKSGDEVRAQLSLVEPVEYQLFGECREITLHIRHEPSELRSLPWREPQVTSEHHSEGVRVLVEASESGAIIRFGVMGSGIAVTEGECSFRSRGLRIHAEQPGVSGVYSYFNPV